MAQGKYTTPKFTKNVQEEELLPPCAKDYLSHSGLLQEEPSPTEPLDVQKHIETVRHFVDEYITLSAEWAQLKKEHEFRVSQVEETVVRLGRTQELLETVEGRLRQVIA